MTDSKSNSAYVLRQEALDAVTQATFGQLLTENDIASYHIRWNAVLDALGLRRCDYRVSQPKSGCYLPMCPRCGLRIRQRVVLGILSWHWREPEAKLSIREDHLHSTSPMTFLDMFDRQVVRSAHGRSRNGMRVAANLVTTAFAGRLKQPKELVVDEAVTAQTYWAHRRLTVYSHEPAAELPRIRGSRRDAGSDLFWTEHVTSDDLADDRFLPKRWRHPDHAGRLIVGDLLRRLDKVTSYLFRDLDDVGELLQALRGSPGGRNYGRVNMPPGGWGEHSPG